MSSNDPRFVVGARVHAKALHVTAIAECHRRYGTNAKTKFVNGTVVLVDSAPSSTQKRAVTLITADVRPWWGYYQTPSIKLEIRQGWRSTIVDCCPP
jgi:hypothetical protein